MIYWMTGLSGAGKTTIASGVKALHRIEVLEGDELRQGLCADLGFSPDDRRENLRRTAHLASHLNRFSDVIVSCITPYESVREMVRSICGEIRFIYVKASVEECIRRDPKGLYARALRGEIEDFTGVQDRFEEPAAPDLVLDTETESPGESIARLLDLVREVDRKYDLYIGRWQPFHRGHEYIIRKQLDSGRNVAIAVRETPVSESDPYPVQLRVEMIEVVFADEVAGGRVRVFPICDISSVNIGRKVGYEVNIIEAPKEIKEISGTGVRGSMDEKGESGDALHPKVEELLKDHRRSLEKMSRTVPSSPEGT